MTQDLILPATALAFLAWLVPKLVSMLLPEGIRFLVVNAIVSTLILMIVAGLYFLVFYVTDGGIPMDRIMDLGLVGNIVFFGRLALSTALIWVPIMALSIAGLPRTWVKAVW